MKDFVHLHLHTDFSLLDGLGKIDQYMRRAREVGMGSLAITDHGALYGAINFYQAARRAGVKPIVGVETYVAPRGRRSKSDRVDAENYHLVLLAKNEVGYKHLIRLVSLAHLEGLYYKPRVDRDLLREYAEGLICLSACLAGEVPRQLVAGNYEQARETARSYRDMFGEENYFLELQHHPSIPEQAIVNQGVIELAKELGLPLVCTADVHYVDREDAAIQDVLIAIQTGKTLDDPKRLKMTGDSNYFRSPAEMSELFAAVPEAVRNTGLIAARCELEIKTGVWVLPHYPVPPPKSAAEYLRELAEGGLKQRLANNMAVAAGKVSPGVMPTDVAPLETLPEVYRDRLEVELNVIVAKGYPTYFLIVQDFANWSRARGIAITTRGSAAGSLVSYALNITSVDPILYRLPFERFLNLSRPSPPDIDMDFEDSRREEVIEYVTSRYGEDRVAQIITFGTMEAKGAVRDAARVMGLPYALSDRITKLIPNLASLSRALETVPELRTLRDTDARVAQLLDTARRLEGVTRNASTHAAGVIFTEKAIVEYAPVQRDSRRGGKLLIQYDMRNAEAIGLMKMDFLGLANLSVLGRAVTLLREYRGIELVPEALPLDDRKTYELLATGETTGLFQVESGGMRKYLRELRPTTIQDIAAMIALYRPGPMAMIPEYIARKHDNSRIAYLDPALEPLLKESYGVLVYQDDILLIAIDIAGYDWEQADKFRKAVGKKDPVLLQEQREKFVRGCVEHGGLSADIARQLWETMQPFASYGFNKAHAAAYAQITYQTAYLKANYPVEYMAAYLSVAMGDSDKVAKGVLDAKRMGIPILPPRVNSSRAGFSIAPVRDGDGQQRDGIRFGLAAVKNVGEGAIEALLAARERQPGQTFRSLDQLCQAVGTRLLNKRALESLTKAGALDDLGARSWLLGQLEDALRQGQRTQRAHEAGQFSLFGELSAPPPVVAEEVATQVETVPRKTLLAWEKEVTGLYISEHPLSLLQPGTGITLLSDVGADEEGARVTVVVLIASIRRVVTKKNTTMAILTVEDLSGTREMVAFPECYSRHSDIWSEDAIIRATAKVEQRNDQVQLICEAAEPFVAVDAPTEPTAGHREAVEVLLHPSGDVRQDLEQLSRLAELLSTFRGDLPLLFHVRTGTGERVLRAKGHGVDWCPELEQALSAVLGQGRAWLDAAGASRPDYALSAD